MEPACKPNFVIPTNRDGNHSSSPDVAVGIKRPTRKRRRLESRHWAGSSTRFPIWSCTTRSLPGHDCHQPRRWALTSPFHPSP